MKNYEKPTIEVTEKKRADKTKKAACPKSQNPYETDWNCEKCEYCIHKEGWSWLSDRCGIA